MFERVEYPIKSEVVENLIFNFTRRAFAWPNFPIESIEILCKLTKTIPMNAFYQRFDSDKLLLIFSSPPFSDEVSGNIEVKQLQESSIRLLTK